MNASRSPDPPPRSERQRASPVPSIEDNDHNLPDASARGSTTDHAVPNGADAPADSEAETEIDSPVKKKEALRQQQEQQQHVATAVKSEKPQKSRIGSLPVPHDDDEEGETADSRADSDDGSGGKSFSNGSAGRHDRDIDMADNRSSEDDSDDLSSPQSDENGSNPPSRATSERPQHDQNGNDDSPNPRKRKHRASSVSLPSSKRRSMDPPKRGTRLRNMHSEEVGGSMDRSPSPRARAHRRTMSTQSALDGTAESRKRRSVTGLRDGKSSKWEESDASSETTSRGQAEERQRPQRGSSRFTSATPGRVGGGREHKRHVNKYGFTRLAEACEDGNLESVKEWREKDPVQLELAEFAGNKPLQIAALNGNAEVVAYLIEQGCQIDCANVDKDTPLIDAAENGHLEVVKLLLDAGVDPLRQNLKGQAALDVVTDDNDDSAAIRAALHAAIDRWNSSEAKQRREEEEEQRYRAGPSKELHFMARTYENLLKLVQNNDRNGVKEFLAARVPVDNAVIAAAARTGDLYLVNMLLVEMSEKKAVQKPEKPMLAVLGTSHFEMVRALTELESFDPCWRDRSGRTWAELAEERGGPMWKQEKELLVQLYEEKVRQKGLERRSSSPVAKRDAVKRRALQARKEEGWESSSSSEERAGERGAARQKRKNGRRLMSRKDMRAVGGKGALSESSEGEEENTEMEVDESTPAAAPNVDETMKPPDTPNTRRRLRSKSISSPAQLQTEQTSPRQKSLRRRSSSLRGPQDLPTLKEEDKEELRQEQARAKREKEAQAQFRIQEAKRLEAKRLEEEAAAAEAKRVEEAAKRAEEEQKAEADRKANELREFEEAEAARKAEEDRVQKERDRLRAQAYIEEVLQALPPPLRTVLSPETPSWVRRDVVAQRVLPLKVRFGAHDGTKGPWILNLQAAAVYGPEGLPLFFQPGRAGYDGSLADTWRTSSLQPADWRVVDQVLAKLFAAQAESDDLVVTDDEPKMEEVLKRTAARYTAFREARAALKTGDCAVALRWVQASHLQSAMEGLIAKGGGVDLDVVNNAAPDDKTAPESQQDFTSCLGRFWDADAQRLKELLPAKDEESAGRGRTSCVQWTEMTVVHEK